MGLVRPFTCPECGGTGEKVETTLKAPGERCPGCGDRLSIGCSPSGKAGEMIQWACGSYKRENLKVGNVFHYSYKCICIQLDKVRVENKRLKAIVDKLPDEAQIQESIACIHVSIDSHIEWKEYRLGHGEDSPLCGDLAHHEACIAGYEQVIRTLNATYTAAKTAEEKTNEADARENTEGH